jgi:hypothetical protein
MTLIADAALAFRGLSQCIADNIGMQTGGSSVHGRCRHEIPGRVCPPCGASDAAAAPLH